MATVVVVLCALSPGPPRGPGAPPHLVTVLSGEVVGVLPEAGALTVRTGSGTAALRGTPWQLAAMVPGRWVELECGDYAGVRWLMRPAVAGAPGRFAISGTFVGLVNGVDRAHGVLLLGQSTFHAHPDALRGVLPGERVEVRFVEVGGFQWIWRLGPADARAGGAVSSEALIGRMVESARAWRKAQRGP